MGSLKKFHGYYPTDKEWLPLKVDSSGRVILSSIDWIPTDETWTFDSTDDPTFTFKITGDKTGKYSPGMRIRLKQGIGYLYFIITAISYTDPDTTVTIYGGTDYDIVDADIMDNYYSFAKAPFGFPLDPIKWTVKVTDTTLRSQANPTAGTWYNLGSFNLIIPIGSWHVSYKVASQVDIAAERSLYVDTTLSTANNSESDPTFTLSNGEANLFIARSSLYISNTIILAASTAYYLNTRTPTPNTTIIYNVNDAITAIIKAVCTYL